MTNKNERLCFNALDSFKVRGNDCFAVLNDRECHDFNHLIGHSAVINGELKQIIGVERCAHSPPWKKGEKIALMCES
jgi:hypothetical protein